MHPFLANRLVEPRTFAALSEVSDGSLISEGGAVFPVVDGIPVMLDLQAKGEQYIEHYQTDAAEFDYFEERDDPATEHDERRVREALLRRLPDGVTNVLDVGCGRAWVANALTPRGVTVCSLDVSLTNPKRALSMYPNDNHCAVVADAFALPFASNSIDSVIASEIIEHVPNPHAFVKELLRVIKPGGVLLVSTPYKEKLRYSLCIHCNQPTPLHAHIHSFDEKVLSTLTPDVHQVTFAWESFGNKVLLFLRTYPLLKWMPYGLWRKVDGLANAVVNKRAHIVVEWRKHVA